MNETIEDKRRVIMQVAYIIRSEGWFSREHEITRKEKSMVKKELKVRAKQSSETICT